MFEDLFQRDKELNEEAKLLSSIHSKLQCQEVKAGERFKHPDGELIVVMDNSRSLRLMLKRPNGSSEPFDYVNRLISILKEVSSVMTESRKKVKDWETHTLNQQQEAEAKVREMKSKMEEHDLKIKEQANDLRLWQKDLNEQKELNSGCEVYLSQRSKELDIKSTRIQERENYLFSIRWKALKVLFGVFIIGELLGVWFMLTKWIDLFGLKSNLYYISVNSKAAWRLIVKMMNNGSLELVHINFWTGILTIFTLIIINLIFIRLLLLKEKARLVTEASSLNQ